jgi:hypothetical protein
MNGERATNLTEADKECHESWLSWNFKSLEYEKAHHTFNRTEPVTYAFLVSKGIGDGTTYSTCDGIPRFRFNSSPTRSTTTVVTVTYQYYEESPVGYDKIAKLIPQPQCDIEFKKCPLFDDLYRSQRLKSGLDDFRYAKPGQEYIRPWGPCGLMLSGCSISTGSEVVLIYWPPRLKSRDICANDGYGTAETINEPKDNPLIVTTNAITFGGFGVHDCGSDMNCTVSPSL